MRPAAQIALTSLDALYREHKQAGETDLAFETGKLTELANYILNTWPDQPEAGPAAELLMQFDLADGNFDRARETVSQIPTGSRATCRCRIATGSCVVRQVFARRPRASPIKARQRRRGCEIDRQPQAESGTFRSSEDGSRAVGKRLQRIAQVNAPTERELLAILSLAQLYLAQSQANQALGVLEDSKLGPLVLLKKSEPSTRGEGVAAEIQRIALLAYLAARPQQIDKAMAALDALEQAAPGDTADKARLMQLLISIAYELQQKFDDLTQRGDSENLPPTAVALKSMLSRLADRSSTADANTLIWLAEAFEKLSGASAAPGHTTSAGKLTPEAEANNRQAIKLYEQILARAKSETGFLPADRAIAVRYRLALLYRSLGDFDQAIARLAEILKAKPTLLSVQIEAARTYQMRGAVDQPEYYIAAIQGGKGDTAAIWGWGKLANRTSQDAKFRETFHEARYNIALCRKLYAELRPENDARKKTLLELAKDSIHDTQQFESTMGGEKWKPKYDALLRDLQKQLDQPPVGLYEFENKPAAAPAAEMKN